MMVMVCRGPLAPLLVGLLVAVIGASFGPLTGFAMNPARDFGPKIVAFFRMGSIAFTGGRDILILSFRLLGSIVGACLGFWDIPFLVISLTSSQS